MSDDSHCGVDGRSYTDQTWAAVVVRLWDLGAEDWEDYLDASPVAGLASALRRSRARPGPQVVMEKVVPAVDRELDHAPTWPRPLPRWLSDWLTPYSSALWLERLEPERRVPAGASRGCSGLDLPEDLSRRLAELEDPSDPGAADCLRICPTRYFRDEHGEAIAAECGPCVEVQRVYVPGHGWTYRVTLESGRCFLYRPPVRSSTFRSGPGISRGSRLSSPWPSPGPGAG